MMGSIPGLPAINLPGLDTIVPLLTADAISLAVGFLNVPWGIYNGIVPVVLADNVTSFEFDQDFRISGYPVEGGQFASYNKVYDPFHVTLQFTAGGNLVRRQALLDSIAAIIGDLNLYNIVSAEAVYTNLNLISYRYRQTAGDGVGLIKVDVVAEQVKTTAPATITSVITNPIDPGASTQVNDGVVQPIDPTQTQANMVPQMDAG